MMGSANVENGANGPIVSVISGFLLARFCREFVDQPTMSDAGEHLEAFDESMCPSQRIVGWWWGDRPDKNCPFSKTDFSKKRHFEMRPFRKTDFSKTDISKIDISKTSLLKNVTYKKWTFRK
jgi:hypothetical protein